MAQRLTSKDGGFLRLVLLSALLVSITLAVFRPVKDHEFLGYDDNVYVTENRYVKNGITSEGVLWAFTSIEAHNWHPTTWLSHMLDVEIFGLDAGRHHQVSLLFHLANVVLLFLLLFRMTGALWRSGAVSVLFAIHPLHVESVAWIAERKDVLSTFFWMLSMAAYLHYANRQSLGRYVLLTFTYAAGLMAKPMLVSLPLVLLLLDCWPLQRVSIFSSSAPGRPPGERCVPARRILLEKLPLLALSLFSVLITYMAQKHGGAVKTMEAYPLGTRMGNAAYSGGAYIRKALLPAELSFFYPHPGDSLPLWKVSLSVLMLIGITWAAIVLRRRAPYFAVGWLWFTVTLLPVLGIVQVGGQAMADRYTYIPLIGLFLVASWATADLLQNNRHAAITLAMAAGAVLFSFGTIAGLQVRYWRNSHTLFNRALEINPDNFVAHNNLGALLERQGKYQAAALHFQEALRARPGYGLAHKNLGDLLAGQGRYAEALPHYKKALEIQPLNAAARFNMGFVYYQLEQYGVAVDQYRGVLKINPAYPDANYNLGLALARRGKTGEALSHYRKELLVNPANASAHYSAGMAMISLGMLAEAEKHFREALKLRKDYGEAQMMLNHTRERLSQPPGPR